MSAAVCLKVIIVGGGICGLSTAIGLSRAGHNITVYEKYREADDVNGQGIILRPNGVKILRNWGLDLFSAGAGRHEGGINIDGKTLAVWRRMTGEDPSDSAGGHKTLKIIRNDLLTLLRKEAKVSLVYDKAVTDYDAERPAVQFDDGGWESADLVIACDGIKSKATSVVTGTESLARPTGFSSCRFLMSDEAMRGLIKRFEDVELLQSKLEDDAAAVWIALEPPSKIFMWLTCRPGPNQIHTFNIVLPDDNRYATSDEWRVAGDKKALLDDFAHWHPVFTEIIRTSNEFIHWKICSREPLKVLHRDRLCVLGDALHAMPPYRAQGATQGIEDAGVLEICLTGLKDKAELGPRLQLFQKLRVPRYTTIQMASTVRHGEPAQKWDKMLEDCRKLLYDGLDPPHLQSESAISEWMIAYDAQAEAAKAVKDTFGGA